MTCISLDPSGHYFISGSYDSRCMIWRIRHHAGLASDVITQPLQTLYGHDDAVNTVAMIWELDMAVSGSKVIPFSRNNISSDHHEHHFERSREKQETNWKCFENEIFPCVNSSNLKLLNLIKLSARIAWFIFPFDLPNQTLISNITCMLLLSCQFKDRRF